VAVLIATGTDPAPLVVRHKCDTPLCTKPEDLTTGTQADNIQDAVTRGRINLSGLALPHHRRAVRRAARIEARLRRCTGCRTVKSFDDFYRAKRNLDGLQSECKDCQRARKAERKARVLK
jgi:hypothetical protein